MKLFISLIISGVIAFSAYPTLVHAEKEIYINLWKRNLQLLDDGKIIKSYRIGVGTRHTPSPVGFFKIIDKRRNWFDGFGPRWMELNVGWGSFGIHGTDKPHSIGGFVSEGCIRMYDKQVEELYDLVSIGTKVTIDGPLTGHPDITYRVLVKGSRGALVQMVQNRLQAAGYYTGECNGRFDRLTEIAVKLYQKDHGLPVTAQIHYQDMLHMGIEE
ncbi:L,D-transpeptidase family protein [Brevibacillus ginsengisoli]|uniref:L,D-transpeptidase family protein n=1 Tax=Brevibacillus ginsengisoli TaxID=363854 RepID=UPI003CEDE81E